MLEPNQREIPLEGLSLVKVIRGDQKGMCHFFCLILLDLVAYIDSKYLLRYALS